MTLKISSTNIQGSTLDVLTAPAAIANAAFAAANVAAATATSALTAANTAVAAAANSAPRVSTISYPGDDTAANTGGGQTVTLTGTGFVSGATVLINGTYASVVSVANNTSMSFTTPAQSAGTYTLYIINTDGGTAISVPGISYSGTPNWTTTAGTLGTSYETANINNTLTATGDAPITYSLYSGTLPPGSSLNSTTGLLSGTSQSVSGSTTYNFTIRATDGQNQDTDRAFSITISPDVVTWSSPADNSTTTAYEYTPISNVTMSATSAAGKSITYTANTLPTGLTITGNTISGTPTVVANTATRLTANAANTFKTATKDINFVVNPDVVTWSSPADGTSTALAQGTAMANVTLSATSAAGKSITYTANALPTGVTINGTVVNGTPTDVGTTNSLITATAATTNRTATRNFTWVVSVANDTYFKNTTLLLNGETTVTPFISDASTNSLALTIAGDTKPVPFSPYQNGYYSVNFPSNTSLATGSVSDLALGTGDYTIECWVMPQVITDALCVFVTSASSAFSAPIGFLLRFGGTTAWQLIVGNGTSDQYSASAAFSTYGGAVGVWTHHAIVRSSGTLRWYVNGVQAYSVADSIAMNQTYLRFGNYASYYWNGYISNFRIVKGTGVYTSAFTPPTTPLTAISGTSILALQSNRLIDSSTNAISLTSTGSPQISPNIPFTANSSYSTYGSTYFDGTGDYITTQSSSGLAFGTGDFTVECWVYLMTGAGTNASFFSSTPATTYNGIMMGRDVIGISGPGGSGGNLVSVTMPTSTWTHVALTRSGTSMRVFFNGVQQGSTATNSTDINSTLGTIGSRYVEATGYLWTGYISNFRVVKGTALYTTTFTPPTSPLTAIANTQLLTLQYNGGATNQAIIDNSNFNNIITRSGNATQGSFSPYSPTGWSTYFNGSSSYVANATSTNNALGAGDYTIEFWCFSNSLGSGSAGSMFYVDVAGYQQLIRHNGSVWECYYKSGVGFTNVSTTTVGINQWVHHALVRSSGVVKWFINGVLYGSAADTTNFTGSTYFQMGMYANYWYDGYVSNVRVVKGTAVYTTSSTTIGATIFTPPTAPLTPITGTLFLSLQSNRIVDNGPLNQTITISGTPSIQAFSPFGSISEPVPLSYSSYLNGTSYVTVPSPSTDPLLGSGNYTVEFWTKTSDTSWEIFAPETGVGLALIITSGSLIFQYQYGQAGTLSVSATSILNDAWHHVAVVRNSGTVTIYFDGTSVGSVADSTNYSGQTQTYDIGYGNQSAGRYLTGYLTNFRIVNGTAVYTSNFTPSTTPLTAITNTKLLAFQNTTLTDNSASARTLGVSGTQTIYRHNPFGYTTQSATSYTPSIHGGSIYFDGTGDYVSAASNSVHNNFGTSDFGVEGWFYFNNVTGTQLIFSHRNSATGAASYVPFLLWTVSGTITVYSSSDNASWNVVNGSTAGTVTANQWYHIAYTRTGTTFRVFVNGVQTLTFTSSDSFSCSQPFQVGMTGPSETTAPMNGYVSDVRMTKGISPYSSNFVPPTQTLTNYSTSYPASLLLNFTNGGIVDQHSSNVLETVGGMQLSTAVKKYNNASMYFNGSNAGLLTPTSTLFGFGSGDFTIEFWYYPTSTSGTNPNIMCNNNGSGSFVSGKWSLHAPHSSYANKYSLWVASNSTSAALLVSATSISTNTWTHIAITRSGSSWKLFLNGTIDATATYAGALDNGTTNPQYIGYQPSVESGRYITAYIDDLRITKGYARYTANFTAPTSAFITK